MYWSREDYETISIMNILLKGALPDEDISNFDDLLAMGKRIIFGKELAVLNPLYVDRFVIGFLQEFMYNEIGVMGTIPSFKMELAHKIYDNAELIDKLYEELENQVFAEYKVHKTEELIKRGSVTNRTENTSSNSTSTSKDDTTRKTTTSGTTTDTGSNSTTFDNTTNGTDGTKTSGIDSTTKTSSTTNKTTNTESGNTSVTNDNTVTNNLTDNSTEGGKTTTANSNTRTDALKEVTTSTSDDTTTYNKTVTNSTNKTDTNNTTTNTKAHDTQGFSNTPQSRRVDISCGAGGTPTTSSAYLTNVQDSVRNTDQTLKGSTATTGSTTDKTTGTDGNKSTGSATTDNTGTVSDTGSQETTHGRTNTTNRTGTIATVDNNVTTHGKVDTMDGSSTDNANDKIVYGKNVDVVKSQTDHNTTVGESTSNTSQNASEDVIGGTTGSATNNTTGAIDGVNTTDENVTRIVTDTDYIWNYEMVMKSQGLLTRVWDIFRDLFIGVIF